LHLAHLGGLQVSIKSVKSEDLCLVTGNEIAGLGKQAARRWWLGIHPAAARQPGERSEANREDAAQVTRAGSRG
jgi:hypothetical protein